MSIGFEAGANFFLYKPIDTDRLLKLVQATQGQSGSNRRRTRRVPVQSRVQLGFGLENLEGETVNVGRGSVVRIMGGNQMGIHLDRLSPTDSGRLEEFLLPLLQAA